MVGLIAFGPGSYVPSVLARGTQIGTVSLATIQGAQLSLNPPNATNIIGPTILRLSNGEYRMYFQARDSNGYANIMSATSTDGLRWTYDSGVRVLHGPTPSSIDWEAGEPDVIQGFNGTYFMPYTGRQQIPGAPTGAFFHKVVFASSQDSLGWAKGNYNFSDPSQTGGFTSSADVIKVNGAYEMYYTGCCQTISGIFRAQSTDFVHWQTMGRIFEVGHDSSTIEVNGTYYMFLMAPPSFTPATPMNQDVLFLAVSSDGINWSNEVYRAVLTNSSSGETINTSTLGDPADMVAQNGNLIVYLNGPMGSSIFGTEPVSSLPKAPAQTTSTITTGAPGASTSTSSTTTTPNTPTVGSTSTSSPTASASTGSSTPSGESTSSTTLNTSTSIPEFPYQILVALVVTFAVVASYLVFRRHTRGPGGHVVPSQN